MRLVSAIVFASTCFASALAAGLQLSWDPRPNAPNNQLDSTSLESEKRRLRPEHKSVLTARNWGGTWPADKMTMPDDWMCVHLSQATSEAWPYDCRPQTDFMDWYNDSIKRTEKYHDVVSGVVLVAAFLVPILCALAALAWVTERYREKLRQEQDVNQEFATVEKV